MSVPGFTSMFFNYSTPDFLGVFFPAFKSSKANAGLQFAQIYWYFNQRAQWHLFYSPTESFFFFCIFFFFCKLLIFLFCIGAQPINNVVVVSGKQQRDFTIHIRVSFLPQTTLPSRLAHTIQQSSMFYVLLYVDFFSPQIVLLVLCLVLFGE